MLAMSSTSSSSHQPTNPLLATNLGGSSSSPWPLLLEDPLATLLPNYHNQHNILVTNFPPNQAFAPNYSHHHGGHQSSTSSPPPPLPPPPPFTDLPRSFSKGEEEVKKDSSNGGTVVTTMKKLNHNASERHRRKKINTLYSSLRSMLPPSDHHPTKKLSIPTTISRVLKYIPELEQRVEALARKKEELLSTISSNSNQLNNKQDHVDDHDHHHMKLGTAKKNSNCKSFTSSSSSLVSSSSTVSMSWLSEQEVMVQVSVAKTDKTFPISEVLLHLQETGLVLVNSSSFESCHGRVFYNLHLQVEGTQGVAPLDSEGLNEKLLNLYEQAMTRAS